MSDDKRLRKRLMHFFITITICLPCICLAEYPASYINTLAAQSVAKHLGWIPDADLLCGGYYYDEPIAVTTENKEAVTITSAGGLLSQRSTSTLEGRVTITRADQQIIANKAYLYRDPVTGKLNAVDMIGDVHLREENSLVLGKKGRYNFDTKAKSLLDIIYRTPIDSKKVDVAKTNANETKKLIAIGSAAEFSQKEKNVYELYRASFTTCPPVAIPAWKVRASHIVLNKNTGRGYATHARLEVKNVPVLYMPYLNFSIDKQRKSGFLWPQLGPSNRWGPFILTPFYWNMAPNYDMTITPGYLSKRGFQFNDKFRYLTPTSSGDFMFSVLPNDRFFHEFQQSAANNTDYTNPIDTKTQPAAVTSAELNRLLNSSDTRKSFIWRNDSRYNDNWSSHVDFNYAGDDYYLRDFGQTLNEISSNQLLQEGALYYKNQNWNFTSRLQTYQTLHPIQEAPVANQYRRFPQFILNADYPDQIFGLDYFMSSEAANFTQLKTPGSPISNPVGTRLHFQPGISLPIYRSAFYIAPRVQFAMTQYNLHQIEDTNTPGNKNRALPIIDVVAGIMMDRPFNLFGHSYQQTLEPQVYYTYIPYRNQYSIPLFDTTVNTLTYDQIFNYNRFTGIDRIGDTNQLAWGITSRLIDSDTGVEKVRIGVGNIIYFANRRITLCTSPAVCNDYFGNPSNKYSLSPVSGVLVYNINPAWNFNTNVIWDPISKQLSNSTVAFQYRPDELRLFNVGYTYARSGDIWGGVQTNQSIDNLKVTDVSGAWPLYHNVSVVGRWSQNWNRAHLQNLVYGLQYDTCCWTLRLVGGRAFRGLIQQPSNPSKLVPNYANEGYIQFSLKGLGDIGSGNPSGLLRGIPGYKSQFGQEI